MPSGSAVGFDLIWAGSIPALSNSIQEISNGLVSKGIKSSGGLVAFKATCVGSRPTFPGVVSAFVVYIGKTPGFQLGDRSSILLRSGL